MWNAKKYSPDCTLLYWQCTSKQLRMQFKKRSEEMQTLRAGCSKVEPKFFCPTADPLPRGAGQPKFNKLEMVTTFTYKPSLVRIDARNFKLSTNTPTNTHIPTERTDYNTLCHSFASVQCITLLLPLASVSAATSQEITPGSAHRSFKEPFRLQVWNSFTGQMSFVSPNSVKALKKQKNDRRQLI